MKVNQVSNRDNRGDQSVDVDAKDKWESLCEGGRRLLTHRHHKSLNFVGQSSRTKVSWIQTINYPGETNYPLRSILHPITCIEVTQLFLVSKGPIGMALKLGCDTLEATFWTFTTASIKLWICGTTTPFISCRRRSQRHCCDCRISLTLFTDIFHSTRCF